MFARAKAMKFHHLPVAGGIYSQDPMLWHYWDIIWDEEAKQQRREDEKRKRESRKKPAGRRGR